MTEITMLIGAPGSGKTTFLQKSMKKGVVLSRDREGGQVADLIPKMEQLISLETATVFLDCTFMDAASRAPFIATARARGIPIKAVLFDAKPELLQFNICWRMCEKFGKVLRTKEDHALAKKDPNVFPAAALFAMLKKFQKPDASEGFSSVEVHKVLRWKLPDRFNNGAVMLDYDGTLRDTKSGRKYPSDPTDIEVFPEASAKLQKLAADGVLLLGASNQSGVAKNDPPMDTCHACFQETNRQLGVHIEYDFDYSAAGPITSWHRKPLPGMGVDAIWRHSLDPSKVVYVGDQTSDRTFAQRCGFQFELAKDFFAL